MKIFPRQPLSATLTTSLPVQNCAQAIYHFRLLCIHLPHTMRFRILIIKLSIHNFLVKKKTPTGLSHPSFGHRLVNKFQDSDRDWNSRPLSILDLLSLYDVPNTLITNPGFLFSIDKTLNDIIQLYLPFSTRISTFNSCSFPPHISDSLVTKCDAINLLPNDSELVT